MLLLLGARPLIQCVFLCPPPPSQEVRDQIRLHRWDEQTHYAAQLAAERSHRIVHRGLRRYREALSVPVAPLLGTAYSADLPALCPVIPASASQPLPLPPAALPSQQQTEEPLTAVDAAPGAVLSVAAGAVASVPPPSFTDALLQPGVAGSTAAPGGRAAPRFLPRLGPLAQRMARLLAGPRVSPPSALGAPAIARLRCLALAVDAAAEHVTGVGRLIANPAEWRAAKHSSLVGILRGIARCGFSAAAAAIPPQLVEAGSTCHILDLPEPALAVAAAAAAGAARTGSADGVGSELAAPDLEGSSRVFFACVDAAVRLRTLGAAGKAHADLSAREAGRMVGFAGHMLATLASQRTQIAASLAQLAALEAAADAAGAEAAASPARPPGVSRLAGMASAEGVLGLLDAQAAALGWAIARIGQVRKSGPLPRLSSLSLPLSRSRSLSL